MSWLDSIPARVEAIQAKSDQAWGMSGELHAPIVLAINALTEAVLLVAVTIAKRPR